MFGFHILLNLCKQAYAKIDFYRLEISLTVLISSIIGRLLYTFGLLGESTPLFLFCTILIVGSLRQVIFPGLFNSYYFQLLLFRLLEAENDLRSTPEKEFMLFFWLFFLPLAVAPMGDFAIAAFNLSLALYCYATYIKFKALLFSPEYNNAFNGFEKPDDFDWAAVVLVLTRVAKNRYDSNFISRLPPYFSSKRFPNACSYNLMNKRFVSGRGPFTREAWKWITSKYGAMAATGTYLAGQIGGETVKSYFQKEATIESAKISAEATKESSKIAAEATKESAKISAEAAKEIARTRNSRQDTLMDDDTKEYLKDQANKIVQELITKHEKNQTSGSSSPQASDVSRKDGGLPCVLEEQTSSWAEAFDYFF
jgi:hypothetical protein